MVTLKVTKRKDGVEQAWFRDTYGRRVGTSMLAVAGKMSWTRARDMMNFGLYWIDLMVERVSKAIGSDDQAMPPLKQPKRKQRWSKSRGKLVEYGVGGAGYPEFKRRLGLKPIRDLHGPGGLVVAYSETTGKKRYRRSGSLGSRTRVNASGLKGNRGHMLDDIRVNYVADDAVKIDISTDASRTKARANEERAPWWGASPADFKKLMDAFAQMFQMGLEEKVMSIGLTAIGTMVKDSGRWLRKSVSEVRRAA